MAINARVRSFAESSWRVDVVVDIVCLSVEETRVVDSCFGFFGSFLISVVTVLVVLLVLVLALVLVLVLALVLDLCLVVFFCFRFRIPDNR